jgi:tetratricopeptide (TPR) repeat protein
VKSLLRFQQVLMTVATVGRQFSGLTGLLCLLVCQRPASAATKDTFQAGLAAYESGQFPVAARAFRDAATNAPSTGAFLNLGLSEWRRGRAGAALCAWEQALWVAPGNPSARNSLAYARRLMDVESPHLHWYERVSSRLPINAWAWITAVGLWMTIGAVLLPDILRRRRSATTQAFAAFGLMVLLLSLPAQVGIRTRQQIGFILQREASLRLTPTADAEISLKLPAGEPARQLRKRGNYVLVKTSQGEGWLEQHQFGLVVPN